MIFVSSGVENADTHSRRFYELNFGNAVPAAWQPKAKAEAGLAPGLLTF